MEQKYMKINWRILVALALIIAAILWTASSVLPLTYSGTNLTFPVGSGPITITNPTNEVVPVKLTGTGARIFTVSSDIDEVSGSSVRVGTGSTSTQEFAFDLPPGASTIRVARGSNVNFVGDTDTRLEASAQPIGQDESRASIIVTAIVVLGALYYISRTTDHRWLNALRGKQAPVPAPEPAKIPWRDDHKGRDGRAYSD
jgi:hypothetical protein